MAILADPIRSPPAEGERLSTGGDIASQTYRGEILDHHDPEKPINKAHECQRFSDVHRITLRAGLEQGEVISRVRSGLVRRRFP